MFKKALVLVLVSLLVIFSNSFACSPSPNPSAEANAVGIGIAGAQANNHVNNTALNCNHLSNEQGQQQGQIQGQTAVGGEGGKGGDSSSEASSNAYTGDNSLTNSITEKVRFEAANPMSVRIGEVSKPVSQVYFKGHSEEDSFSGDWSNAIEAGVTIPITWGTGVNSALNVEQQHLRDRNLHEREKHQGEMAQMCMTLHKYVLSTGIEMSPELWSRCSGFTHTNNERTNKLMEQIPPNGRHNQKMNPLQLSPHKEPYHVK
jgi:hypothetical protein